MFNTYVWILCIMHSFHFEIDEYLIILDFLIVGVFFGGGGGGGGGGVEDA
jgi:hypothetical protein